MATQAFPRMADFMLMLRFGSIRSNEANYGRYDVGVFVARDVNGPYHDVFEAPMKDTHGVPLEGLSPAFIKGNDGSPYLIWGSGDTEGDEATVMLARLKQNMVELGAEPHGTWMSKKETNAAILNTLKARCSSTLDRNGTSPMWPTKTQKGQDVIRRVSTSITPYQTACLVRLMRLRAISFIQDRVGLKMFSRVYASSGISGTWPITCHTNISSPTKIITAR